MTNPPYEPMTDLQEVATRNRVARQIIAGFIAATPSATWDYIHAALADTTTLTAEIRTLRTVLVLVRLDCANLAAAALATIDAYREGEHNPISYLCDELTAQGQHPRGCP